MLEAGIAPIDGTPGIAVLDGVVVDVFDMPPVVLFVAQQMFPIPMLPDSPPAFAAPGAVGNIVSQAGIAMLGEPRLDQAQAGGKVLIVVRQRQEAVKVVWQHYSG